MLSKRTCPLCKSIKKNKFESIAIDSAHMHVEDLEKISKREYFYSICLNCGLMFIDDPVEESILEEIYNEDYWSDSNDDQDNLKKLSRQFCRSRGIASMIRKKGCEPRNTLDIGGGLGGIGLGIRYETNSAVSIVDRSLGARSHAKKLGFKSEKTLSDYIDKKNCFDLVILCHSLEHFYDPISLINEIRNVTNAQSYIYIEVPNAKWHPSAELFHETMWTKRTLKKFMTLVGFKDIDVWESSNPYQNSVNIYLHGFGRMGQKNNKSINLSSKFDVFNSRLSRKIYRSYEYYNWLIDKIPSYKIRNLFSYNYRKAAIPDLQKNYSILKNYISSNN